MQPTPSRTSPLTLLAVLTLAAVAVLATAVSSCSASAAGLCTRTFMESQQPTSVCCPAGCLSEVQQQRASSVTQAAAAAAVYGSWPYHVNSSMCLAAIHAGLITDADGGCAMLAPFLPYHQPLVLDLTDPQADAERFLVNGQYTAVAGFVSGYELFPFNSSNASLSNGVQSLPAAQGWGAAVTALPEVNVTYYSFVVYSRGSLVTHAPVPPWSARSGHATLFVAGVTGFMHLVLGGMNATHYLNDVWLARYVANDGPFTAPRAPIQWMRLPDAPFTGRADIGMLARFPQDIWLFGGRTGHHCGLEQLSICSDEQWRLYIRPNISSPTFGVSFTWSQQPPLPFALCGSAFFAQIGGPSCTFGLGDKCVVMAVAGQRSYTDSSCREPIQTTNDVWYNRGFTQWTRAAEPAPFSPRQATVSSFLVNSGGPFVALVGVGGGVQYISHSVNETTGRARLTEAAMFIDQWMCGLHEAAVQCRWFHHTASNLSSAASVTGSFPIPAVSGGFSPSQFLIISDVVYVGGRSSGAALQAWEQTRPPLYVFNDSLTRSELRANVTHVSQPMSVDAHKNVDEWGYAPWMPSLTDIQRSRFALPLHYALFEDELNDPRGPFMAGSDWLMKLSTHWTSETRLANLSFSLPMATSAHRQLSQQVQRAEDSSLNVYAAASSENTTRALFDVSLRRYGFGSVGVQWVGGLVATRPHPPVLSGGQSGDVFYRDWMTVAPMCCPRPDDPSYRAVLGNGTLVAAVGLLTALNISEAWCLQSRHVTSVTWRCAEGFHLEPPRAGDSRETELRCLATGLWVDVDYATVSSCVKDRLVCRHPLINVADEACVLPPPSISSISIMSSGRGCRPVDALTLEECAVEEMVLSITGSYLTQPLLVLVGGHRCEAPVLHDDQDELVCAQDAHNDTRCEEYGTGMLCTLLPMLGYRVPVVLFSGDDRQMASVATPATLSFAAPVITNVTGINMTDGPPCAGLSATQLSACPYDTPFRIAVCGTDFWLDSAQPPLVSLAPLHIDCDMNSAGCPTCLITPTVSSPLATPIPLLLRQAGGLSNVIFGNQTLSPAAVALASCPAGSRDIGHTLPPDADPSSRCQPCPAGQYSNVSLGVGECADCPIGTFSPRSGLGECEPCAQHSFGNETRLQQCFPCQPNSYQNLTRQTDCHVCDLNQYLQLTADGPRCRSCLDGVQCLPNGTVMAASSSLYLMVEQSTGLISSTECRGSRCVAPAACSSDSDCVMSTTTVERTNLSVVHACAAHRLSGDANPLCAACEPGYEEWSGECVRCDLQHVNWPLLVLSVLCGLLLIWALHRLPNDRHHATLGISLYFMQNTLLFFSSEQLPQLLSVVNLDLLGDWPRSSGSGSCLLPLNAQQKIALRAVMPVLAVLYLGLLLALQSAVRAAMRAAGCAAGGLSDRVYSAAFGGRVNAVEAVDRHRGSGGTFNGALRETLLSAQDGDKDATLAAAQCAGGGQSSSWSEQEAEAVAGVGRFSPMLRPYLRSLVRIAVYGYTSVTVLTLSYFHCQSVGQYGRLLYDYPTVSCDLPAYQALLPVVVVLLVALVILPPVLLCVVLRSQRERVARRMAAVQAVRSSCGEGASASVSRAAAAEDGEGWLSALADHLDILYAVYRPGMAWYAVVILLRRLLLVTIFVFAPQRSMFIGLAAVSGCVALLHTAAWPYSRRRDNALEFVTLLALFLQCIVILAWPLPWSSQTGPGTALAVMAWLLLIGAPACLLLVSAAQDKIQRCGQVLRDYQESASRRWSGQHAGRGDMPPAMASSSSSTL